jgi:hypothetical protein
LNLISSIFGGLGGKKPRTIPDVEESLSRVAAERETARAAVSAAMKRRDELLLSGTDQEILALDAEADRHRLVLERLDRMEPVLLTQMTSLRTGAKAALWAELRGRYDASATSYRDALRVAVERKAELQNQHDEIRRRGFEHESRSLVTPTQWVTKESLNDYDIAIERSRESARQRPTPTPAAVAPAPKEPVKSAPVPKVTPKPAVPPPPPKPFVPPTPDADGHVRITIIRAGVEIGGRGRVGAETVSVPAKEAERIVMSGAADYAAP